MSDQHHAGSALLLDADDTLWENNIYFLEVTERFLISLEVHGVGRDAARDRLNATERKNLSVFGYGSRAFAHSVAEAFSSLAPGLPREAADDLVQMALAIGEREVMEMLPGVREGLERLSRAYRLILVTKGDREEQERKIERSGLAPYFSDVEVVEEKTAAMYRDLVVRLQLDPARTWMIGNSPRSDINPALEAGLRAVLVPHPQTWELEVEEVRDVPDRLTIVDRFGDVVALFASPDEAESR